MRGGDGTAFVMVCSRHSPDREQDKTVMATEMRPFLNALFNPSNHAIPDRRDRTEGVSPGASDNPFNNLLGRAQARRAEPRQEPAPLHLRQAAHRRTSGPATTHEQTDRSEQTHMTAPEARSAAQSGQTRSDKVDNFDKGQNEESTGAGDKNQSAGLSPEILIAAGFPPPALTDGQAKTEVMGDFADAPETTEAAAPEGRSEETLELESQRTPATAQVVSGLVSDQTAVAASAGGAADAETKATPAPTKASDSPAAKTDMAEAARLAEAESHHQPTETFETFAPVIDHAVRETHKEPEDGHTPLVVTAAHIEAKPAAEAGATDHSQVQPPFDSVLQVTDMAAGQGAPSAEQFLSQDRQSSSESRGGSDPATSDLLPADDNTLRPPFLDQAINAGASSTPSSDSRIGRGETGQASMVHISDSERIEQVRKAFPSAQTVTLDLDPLDLGPLRVRIMMTEQTVHAHIRTEHGELGHSLLQQGPSLEASLRTTGLEMGMLRVTVDQHQQGGGENAWAFQQQPGRSALAPKGPAASSAEEERTFLGGQGFYNNGRVSFFA